MWPDFIHAEFSSIRHVLFIETENKGETFLILSFPTLFIRMKIISSLVYTQNRIQHRFLIVYNLYNYRYQYRKKKF